MFWPFGTFLGPSGPFWTISTTSLVDAQVHRQVVLNCCFQLWFLTKSFSLKTRRDWFQVLAFLRSVGVIPVKENIGIFKVERDQTTRLYHVTHLHLLFNKQWKLNVHSIWWTLNYCKGFLCLFYKKIKSMLHMVKAILVSRITKKCKLHQFSLVTLLL